MGEHFLQTQFGRVYAQTAGPETGVLVLGLHGLSRRNGWHTWQPVMEPLAKAGFRVVCFDMPGWGQSPPIHEQELSQPEAVNIVLSVMDTLEPVKPAVLMGKSWGGSLALEIAMSQPARISKLILTAPAFMDFGRLSAVLSPVLLVWAEDDPVIPVAYAERYRAIPNLKIVTYATGGHSAAMNNVVDFAPTAVEFLRQFGPLSGAQSRSENPHD